MAEEEVEQDLPEISFLTLDQVLTLHREAILRYTPTESTAVINLNALQSAVSQPQQTWGGKYLYDGLPAMASAYLVGLVCNHAFENGNKRVGFAACSVFLRINGYRLSLTDDDAIDITLCVATGEADRKQIEAILTAAIEAM